MKVIKILLLSVMCYVSISAQTDQPTIISGDTVEIYMAALDQPFMYNRMGTAQPTGMIFALENDIVAKPPTRGNPLKGKVAGNVQLADEKRPRPIVLRANVGDILKINFTNYLRPFDTITPPKKGPQNPFDSVEFYKGFPTAQETVNGIYPATRMAGVHIVGTEWQKSEMDDGYYVGSNESSLVPPNGKITYYLRAAAEGSYVLHSAADNIADGTIRAGQISNGLFGSLVVQPPEAEWYRSQVPEEDLYKATKYWLTTDGVRTDKPDGKPTIEFKQRNKGFPIIDYNAIEMIEKVINGKKMKVPMPLLKMYNQETPNRRHLVHSDLTALITGPNAGDFPIYLDGPSFMNVPASPNRRQPYREFSIHYHEAPYAVQAFPEFYNNTNDSIGNIVQTIQGGVDQFAFNYGTGGIGAEIFANRVGVGPMADCVDCAYEEFFLSAWAVGDPAQIVDIPANVSDRKGSKKSPQELVDSSLQQLMLMEAALISSTGQTAESSSLDMDLKATKVKYPDDPSNVYHSYMNDHVKFRINHCGAGITHVHHQHAHQWLHSPNSDNGHYLDSQTINPGTSYTLEMLYSGSGNLNKTVGDQIFHCHFYPHFAQGMWAMWRVHDVLETGTVLAADGSGVVAKNSRALPDGEISAGTPIPGVVPISTLPMAPLPSKVTIQDGQIMYHGGDVSPGYPFYIPGIAGQRAPHPPLDFAVDTTISPKGDTLLTELNGGLPRNVVFDGNVPFTQMTRYDWTKITSDLRAIRLPEEGTYYEKLAMKAHATRVHNTLTPRELPGNFLLNGLPPVQGAPYADPAVDENGYAVGTKRTFKAANIQVDAVLNELGWHYPQQRPIVLWGDVASTMAGELPPQPFFMRANSGEYIEYWHTNLVPEYYELDDYQVRTPTDIIGQHIHLVKFDVTSSDGAANGWNYEDGTLSPELVADHIKDFNEGGAFYEPDLEKEFLGKIDTKWKKSKKVKLEIQPPNPLWGTPPCETCWDGAQTTIQRWYSNPLYNNKGEDRTLRTVFTHDHFSPSTHQQIGLYAGLLIEPAGSTWLNTWTGDTLGVATVGRTRKVATQFGVDANGAPINGTDSLAVSDGGPTDWQAIISTVNPEDSYREFMFEFQDNQQAYTKGSRGTPDIYPEFDPPKKGSVRKYAKLFKKNVDKNYRGWIDSKHVIAPPPPQTLPDGTTIQAPELVTTGNRGTLSLNYRNSPLPVRVDTGSVAKDPRATDLAYAYSSLIERNVEAMNHQPTPGYIDKSANKFIWPVQPYSAGMLPKDPYTPLARAYQGDKIQMRTLVGAHVNPHFFNVHGVKWYFEPSFENSGFRSTQMMSLSEHFEMNFRLPYTKASTTDYLYSTNADDTGLKAGTWGLMRAYDEKQDSLIAMPNNPLKDGKVVTPEESGCGCPSDAEVKKFNVTAISIDKYQQFGPDWGILVYNRQHRNFDSKAIVFVRDEELEAFKHDPSYIPRPLVLRANAGDCLNVRVKNDITPEFVNNVDSIIDAGTTYNYQTSFTVGLHAELLSYDVSQYDGTSVGINELGKQLLPQSNDGSKYVEYNWYAGQWNSDGDGFTPEPVEFGTVVLTAPDPLLQYVSGLYGALIIEPEGTYWIEDQNDPTSANIYRESDDKFLFREHVLQFQDNIQVVAEPIQLTDTTTASGVNARSAVNYKTDPLANRVFYDAGPVINFNSTDVSDVVSNFSVLELPETPTFVAKAQTPVRFRVMYPGGVGDGSTFDLHGHVWQEEPYTDKSTKLGYNELSQWMGARGQLGALNSFDLLINSAGGNQGVMGDYLYRDYRNDGFQNGIWGLFTVTDGNAAIRVARITVDKKTGSAIIRGANTVNPTSGKYDDKVNFANNGLSIGSSNINQSTGEWSLKIKNFNAVRNLTITSRTKDGADAGSIEITGKELFKYIAPPRSRIKMQPVFRPTSKHTEPGSNRGSFLKARDRD